MKIIQLRASNVKALKAVDITPTDSTVVIAGRNGQGKSSILDAMILALAGKDAAKLMVRPIRDGEERAEVSLDLGDYRVTRSWTANDKSYLKVEAKDGTKVASPQALLDGFASSLTFDPLGFSRMSTRQQRDALLKIVPLAIDLDEWEQSNKAVFDERTQVGRDVTQLEGQLAGMPPVVTDTEEEVNITDLLQKTEQAKERYRWCNDLVDAVLVRQATINRLREQIAKEEELLRADEAELDRSPDRGEQAKDIERLSERLATAEETNRRVRALKERQAVERKLADTREKYDHFTSVLDTAQANKAEAIAKADMPIAGLSVDEQGVTFNGIPFAQLSSAEQLKVSLAIAMAMNPTLRVIRILDGSLLDDDSMKVVREMVAEKNFQCWIERVEPDESGPSIIIEDGEVAPSQSHA